MERQGIIDALKGRACSGLPPILPEMFSSTVLEADNDTRMAESLASMQPTLAEWLVQVRQTLRACMHACLLMQLFSRMHAPFGLLFPRASRAQAAGSSQVMHDDGGP